ncbi:DUF3578 domain-containing protein [Paracoccus sp. 1_MG-2023]|uniref:MrcB family domain-containing protein n=1 Tax=unclassified Paracoccus (in: a-proteobacteria) TaxID=2688777 RepID=UPI001C094C39|nr:MULTISPECIES: DUF3578 domain-containing protein [unclassified Paracoccus (in: a-proteobacteria)]MBU2957125.1 DUF3578 domain-containing protein [Paracoccus sp. C2R09]MDO6669541.1 DUF3578 domain-containing protein [Paracoccus sp. 1_MG-2023]
MPGSPYAARFRRDLPLAAQASLPPESPLTCRASTGARGWAAVPWLACFDPRITRSMRRGVYVAIFIVSARAQVVLALQHGAEDMLDRHGLQGGLQALSARAQNLREVAGPIPGLRPGPSDLGATAPLPRGYQAGTILQAAWPAERICDGTLSVAFRDLAARYLRLVDKGAF